MVGYDLPGFVCVRQVNDKESGGDEIYLALRVTDGAEVAVRVFAQPVRSDRDRERFEHEVTGLRTLTDPYLLSLLDAGVSADGQAFVVTEFCVAGSLNDHLVTVGRFTPAEVRRIGSKVAGALAAAHSREIYHRNIKPASILITAAGEPALSGFSLVTLATVDGDYRPPLPPKPKAFAAPEAYLPELMTVSADIYSLGATLYALLAGWAPRSVDPLSLAIDGDTLVDLPKVPWALMAVVRKAMALDPKKRFHDAFELRAALAELN